MKAYLELSRRHLSVMTALLILNFLPVLVTADEISVPNQEQIGALEPNAASRFLVAPYAWIPALQGSIGIEGFAVTLDLDVDDLAGGIDAGAMGYLQWSRDEGFFYTDLLGLKFSDHRFEPLFNLQIEADLSFIEIGYGQQFELAELIYSGRSVLVSHYVGIRYLRLDAAVNFAHGHIAATSESIDLAAGAIVNIPLSRGVSALIKLDAAGFDLNDTEYWNTIVGLDYRINNSWSFTAGYRYSKFVSTAGSKDALDLDLSGSGALFGVQIEF